MYVRFVGHTGAAPVIIILTRPPTFAWREIVQKNSINKPYQWLNLKAQCPVGLGCVFTQDSIFTWTFLKISLSQMVSRLATPMLSSAVFLLKAKCSSHFFSGLSAWLNICRDMRQACIQEDSQKKRKIGSRDRGHWGLTLSHMRLSRRGTTGKTVGFSVCKSSIKSRISPWKNPIRAPWMRMTPWKSNEALCPQGGVQSTTN